MESTSHGTYLARSVASEAQSLPAKYNAFREDGRTVVVPGKNPLYWETARDEGAWALRIPLADWDIWSPEPQTAVNLVFLQRFVVDSNGMGMHRP